jgi:hypothetical protein
MDRLALPAKYSIVFYVYYYLLIYSTLFLYMSGDDGLDPEIREIIDDEKRLARGVGREAVARRKAQRRLARKGLEAIQAKDSRAFAMHLQEAGVVAGSDEWKRAWIAFRKACGES